MNLKSRIPWWAKIISKLILSRLPFSYSLWRRIGLFQLGHMEQADYAYGVFRRHFDRVDFARKFDSFVALELGPGDLLSSALLAHAFGASSSYLIDNRCYANKDLALYRMMINFLVKHGYDMPDSSAISSLTELLQVYNAHYEVEGLASLRMIPDQSVDFIWSQAVCEHIRKDEFLDTMRELHRVLRNDGVFSNRVDLRDHLGGALNNLRFSESLWERNAIANAGFYTNRIRFSEMIRLFEKAGFDVEVVQVERWKLLPTPRWKIASNFQHWSDDELRISGFDVILRPL